MLSTLASVGAAALVRMPGSAAVAAHRNGRADRAGQAGGTNLVARHVSAAWSRLVAWKMRRATRVILQSLDDRILKDIGLERSDIDEVLRDLQLQVLARSSHRHGA